MPSAEYQREWKKRHPGKQAEYSRKWYDSHKEEYGPTRHRKNKTPEQLEKLRTQGRAIRLKHKDKCNAYTKEWSSRNKERRKEYINKWYKTPQGLLHARTEHHKRKARKMNAGGSFTKEDIKDLYATQGGRCYYCSVEIEKYHIEHMVPLSRGGRNDVSNICLACAPCNLKKHTKTAEEFLNEREIRCTRTIQGNDRQEEREERRQGRQEGSLQVQVQEGSVLLVQ